jgi:hypothetical protein
MKRFRVKKTWEFTTPLDLEAVAKVLQSFELQHWLQAHGLTMVTGHTDVRDLDLWPLKRGGGNER